MRCVPCRSNVDDNLISDISSAAFLGLSALSALCVAARTRPGCGGERAVDGAPRARRSLADNMISTIPSGTFASLSASLTTLCVARCAHARTRAVMMRAAGRRNLGGNPSSLCIDYSVLESLKSLKLLTVPSPWPCSSACPSVTFAGATVCASGQPAAAPPLLSLGVIAGIASAAALLLCAVAFALWRRRRSAARESASLEDVEYTRAEVRGKAGGVCGRGVTVCCAGRASRRCEVMLGRRHGIVAGFAGPHASLPSCSAVFVFAAGWRTDPTVGGAACFWV